MSCAAQGKQTTAAEALSEQWLRRTDEALAFYRRLRDEFAPGKPFWNIETADAECGGNPWADTFLDTFRYLDQLGRLAKQDVKVVVLESGIPIQDGVHVYAHCLHGVPGGVALLVINNDKARPHARLACPGAALHLAAPANLQGMCVQLNGSELKLGDDDTLPDLNGAAMPAGDFVFAPTTITFLALQGANSNACR
jgi:hypothetical protein